MSDSSYSKGDRIRLTDLCGITAEVFDTGVIDGEPVVYVRIEQNGTNAAFTLDAIERL